MNDYYKRFVKPDVGEKGQVAVGRLSIVVLMALSAVIALLLSNALQAFHILLQIGAGTGLLFLLRWFWWRINAFSELAAMAISFLVAVYFEFVHVQIGLPALVEWQRLVIGVAVTTVGWVAVTFMTQPSDRATLLNFVRKVRPGGPGWRRVIDEARAAGETVDASSPAGWDVPTGLLCAFLGMVAVYSWVFATGFWLYGNVPPAVITTLTGAAASAGLIRFWSRVQTG